MGPSGAAFGPQNHQKWIRDAKRPQGKRSRLLGPRIEQITSADVWIFVAATGPSPDFRTGREGAERSFSEIRGAPTASATWQMKDAPGTGGTGEEAPNKNPRASKPRRSGSSLLPPGPTGRPEHAFPVPLPPRRSSQAAQHGALSRDLVEHEQLVSIVRRPGSFVLFEHALTYWMKRTVCFIRLAVRAVLGSTMFSRLFVEGMCNHSIRMLSV